VTVALQVTEQAGRSDVGRQREANEDNWVIAPPFYVVADGMGGARAGEVASELVAEVFRAASADGGTPEQILEAQAKAANSSIFELAERDESRRGMGTTLTAALVNGDDVSIGHVGDSRAYRLRDGELEQLTHDHSLVAELVRSGQITAAEAEVHPQRSIITRALGPEPTVEVDTHTHRAKSGDIYLLASDGLTGMISDGDVAAILRSSGDLESAADALILAANQSGGKDNITVVLFRTGDADAAAVPPEDEPTLAADETIHQGLTADDVQAAVAEQERAGAVRREAPRAAQKAPVTAGPARRWPRRLATTLGILLVIAVIAGALVLGARSVYFVGTNGQGLVTLYRGVPYDLPLGIDLYSEQAVSGVPAQSLTSARRDRILNHEWRSRSDAQDLVRQLEQGTLDGGGR
jgi:PPM family protein phosphatase